MSGSESDSDGSELNVADILGENYPSPTELADSMDETQLLDMIAGLNEQDLDLQTQIAQLQSERKKLRAERSIAQDAIRITRDRGLE